MLNYLEQGHIEKNVEIELSLRCSYIIHYIVIKYRSSTSNLRFVFGASSKSLDNVSIRDTLLIGPKLQKEIASILLPFRLHSFVFTVDIQHTGRQMLIFLQCLVKYHILSNGRSKFFKNITFVPLKKTNEHH